MQSIEGKQYKCEKFTFPVMMMFNGQRLSKIFKWLLSMTFKDPSNTEVSWLLVGKKWDLFYSLKNP